MNSIIEEKKLNQLRNISMIDEFINLSGSEHLINIEVQEQRMYCYEKGELYKTYLVSTAKNGIGNKINSECTPTGWHKIHRIIGQDAEINSVFVARQWTGEIYNDEFAVNHPQRDWILTRIIQLIGLEPGLNLGGDVDTLKRYIYIHGTPDTIQLGIPGSHGCIRMKNTDIIELAKWLKPDSCVCIG